MKKLIPILAILLILTGCRKEKEESTGASSGCDLITDCADSSGSDTIMTIREKYESVNGTESSSGKTNRTISIPEDHPLIKTSGSDILKKIENKETFYLYVGDELCPWCRSVIEKFIEAAAKADVKEVFYIEIWDDEGEEIFRDKYVSQDGELKKTVEGDPSYTELLKAFDNFLEDYTLTVDKDTIDVGEKRIYAPNFFYVEDGVLKKMTTGISEKQEDSRDELTKEILEDEERLFSDFFTND